MDQYLEMRELAEQGLSMTEIGRRSGWERKTIRRYLSGEAGPPVLRQKREAIMRDCHYLQL